MDFSSYYILKNKRVIQTNNFLEWTMWTSDFKNRRIALTNFPDGESISTVFLTLNAQWLTGYPPILFETMIFGGPLDEYCERYSTYEQAIKGHRRITKNRRFIRRLKETNQAGKILNN